MPVYRVLGSRTELYLIEAVVRAGSREEAEAMFYGLLENEGEALSWIQDLDSSDAEIDSIEPLDPQHHAVPSQDRRICLFCGRPVTWTGTPAARSPTGMTISGPWVHVERPIAGEGIGF